MPRFSSWRNAGLLLAFLLVAGCSHVPVPSLARLSGLDLMTVDLSVLRAAVRAPSAIVPIPGETKLVISYWRDGEDKKTVEVPLKEDAAPASRAAVSPEERPGTRITVFRVAEADLARLEAARAAIAAAKAADQGGRRTHGSLSVALAGCAQAPLPDGPLLFSTYLRVSADGDFFPLVKDMDLRSLAGAQAPVGEAAAGEAMLKPCAS